MEVQQQNIGPPINNKDDLELHQEVKEHSHQIDEIGDPNDYEFMNFLGFIIPPLSDSQSFYSCSSAIEIAASGELTFGSNQKPSEKKNHKVCLLTLILHASEHRMNQLIDFIKSIA